MPYYFQKIPAHFIFEQDIISLIKHVANWEFIWMNKQKLIDKSNKSENAKQQVHFYKKGNLILLEKGTSTR